MCLTSSLHFVHQCIQCFFLIKDIKATLFPVAGLATQSHSRGATLVLGCGTTNKLQNVPDANFETNAGSLADDSNVNVDGLLWPHFEKGYKANEQFADLLSVSLLNRTL